MWTVQNDKGNGILTLVNTDNSATCTTDYQRADALARKVLGTARMYAKGDALGRAIRSYIRD